MLEQGEGGILSPCKVYAARGKDGALRHSPASVGKPEMVPSWFPIKFAEVLTTLKKEPSAYSVLLYDGEVHFDPVLHSPAAMCCQRQKTRHTPEELQLLKAKTPENKKSATTEAAGIPKKAEQEAQMREQQAAAARKRAKQWELEREALLTAAKKLADNAQARGAKAEAEAMKKAKRERARLQEEQAQTHRGRGKAQRFQLPSLACLLLAAVGWVRLPNAHPIFASLVEAVHASPFHKSIFNGQPEHERAQRFYGRSDAWASEEEVTLDKILDDAVSCSPPAHLCAQCYAWPSPSPTPLHCALRQGLMATSDGRRKTVKDCYALKSTSCLPDELNRPDIPDVAAVHGRQPRHWDIPDNNDEGHLEDLNLPATYVPLSVMVAIEPGTKLWIYPDGCDTDEETALLVELNVGEVLVWRGDLVHAVAGYGVDHYRIHAYVDSPFFNRKEGTGLCLRRTLFPKTTMHAAELEAALKQSSTADLFDKLVFYLEACEVSAQRSAEANAGWMGGKLGRGASGCG